MLYHKISHEGTRIDIFLPSQLFLVSSIISVSCRFFYKYPLEQFILLGIASAFQNISGNDIGSSKGAFALRISS